MNMTRKQRQNIAREVGKPIISKHYKPVYLEKLEKILLTETEMFVIHREYFELRKNRFRKGKVFFHERFLRECIEVRDEPISLSIEKIMVCGKSPTEPTNDDREHRNTSESINALKTFTNAPQSPSSKLVAQESEKEQHRKAAARQMEVYRAHQDAIRRGGTLMCEITKGINAGTDPLVLLLKACEFIGNMTGDTRVFYEKNRQNIIAIYGAGLLEPAPIQMELDEVRKRLAMLTRLELDAEPEDNRRRIKAAVKVHEERAAMLEARILQATKDIENT